MILGTVRMAGRWIWSCAVSYTHLDVYKRQSLPILDWGRGKGRVRVARSNVDLVDTQAEQEMCIRDRYVTDGGSSYSCISVLSTFTLCLLVIFADDYGKYYHLYLSVAI